MEKDQSMMEPITIVNRETGEVELEKVYGQKALELIYGDRFISSFIGAPLLHAFAKRPFLSSLYGWIQKSGWSQRKIVPFIEEYGVDTSEFADSIESYHSFNDFFIRKLKAGVRPIVQGDQVAVLPADGRYLFFPKIDEIDHFFVKGTRFSVDEFLVDPAVAKKFRSGTLVLARLCPVDYHRFHFPVGGQAGEAKLINGWLYSVNPWALATRPTIFSENRRVVTLIETKCFGQVAMVEIGATNVGSIHQTYTAGTRVEKGSEKGYFSFGGSAIALLFEPGAIELASDLTDPKIGNREVLCKVGQLLGRAR